MIRIAAIPLTRPLPAWPGADAERQRTWITQVWAEPTWAEAISHASPDLAQVLREAMRGTLRSGPTASAAGSLARYLLRMQHRPTPFGLLAGPTAVAFGSSTVVELGEDGQTLAAVDCEWLHHLVSDLEQDPKVLRELTVVADPTLVARGERISVSCLPGKDGPEATSLRSTPVVRETLALTRTPIPVRALLGKLLAAHPGTGEDTAVSMLAGLVAHRVLLTDLRPPASTSDVLAWVLRRLEETGAAHEVGARLDLVRQLLLQHDRVPPRERAALRARASAVMSKVHKGAEPRIVVDTRPSGQVVLPSAVTREAERAVEAMTRITPYPHGSPAWTDYRSRFLERYSMGTVVPLLELTDPETGLGYPVGYRGTVLPRPVLATTARDEHLLHLAQDAALTGRRTVTLTEADLKALSLAEPTQVPAHLELCFTVLSRCARDLDRGEFMLLTAGLSLAAGTTSGRFMPLLDAAELERWETTMRALPTLTEGALRAQVSSPALKHRTANVGRAPLMAADLIAVGEHNRAATVELTDLGVLADADRLYLVRLSTGQVLEPSVMNAVELSQSTHPLVRFLSEVHRSHAAVLVPFAWGAAARLPYLPQVRYGRTVLSAACWRLRAQDLAGDEPWAKALECWRETYKVPRLVYAGTDDRQLRLDLNQHHHQDLLRRELARHGSLALHQAPDDADLGWIGRAHQVTIPLASNQKPATSPVPASPRGGLLVAERGHARLPGNTPWAFLKLYCHPARADDLLTGPLAELLALLKPGLRRDTDWWFIRYADPEPHLRIRLHMADADWFSPFTQGVGAWAYRELEAGTLQRLAWDTDRPETGRYGTGATLKAAEAVFAADSAAAVAELRTDARDLRPALTTASHLDIATHFLGTRRAALQWMVTNLRQHAGTAPRRNVLSLALHLTDESHPQISDARIEADVTQAWTERAAALVTYRNALEEAGPDPTQVLASLLHMHHNRVAGITPDAEADCLRLARTSALSWLNRTHQGTPR